MSNELSSTNAQVNQTFYATASRVGSSLNMMRSVLRT